MLAVLLTLLLAYQINTKETLTKEREKCIKCICNAVSACWELPLCANKTVSLAYWLEAGSPTVDDQNDEDDSVAFAKCIQSEKCVFTTIDQYTKIVTGRINDINCDGIVDCRDHLAVHKHGMGAKDEGKVFTRAETRRFDLCIGDDVPHLTDSGWKPQICIAQRNNFT